MACFLNCTSQLFISKSINLMEKINKTHLSRKKFYQKYIVESKKIFVSHHYNQAITLTPKTMKDICKKKRQLTVCTHSYWPNFESKLPFCKDRSLSVKRGPISFNATFLPFLNSYLAQKNKSTFCCCTFR